MSDAIPTIIHQSWKDSEIPAGTVDLVATWKRLHGGWDYRLWTDEQNRELVRSTFPDLLARYDSYPHAIQRADAARYLYLHTYGGIYVDLDFECLQPMDDLLAGQTCIFGLEPAQHAQIHQRPFIVGNAWMAAVPGHPFFRAVLEELVRFDDAGLDRNTRVLESTGPLMLTRLYTRLQPATVTLLADRYLYPLSLTELESGDRGDWRGTHGARLADAYAVHHFAGTWWKGATA